MGEALPITMPTIVSRLRRRLLRRVDRAIRTVSVAGMRRFMVWRRSDQCRLCFVADDAHLDQIRGSGNSGVGACGLNHEITLLQQVELLGLDHRCLEGAWCVRPRESPTVSRPT